MITILMSTYNGAKYVQEQLDSLFEQTYQDFVIVINDDFSSDDTVNIIKNFQSQYPDKITLFENALNTGSPKYNFLKLMINHKDNYLMLCDQDDIWKPNKIELTLRYMRQAENTYGYSCPILVHSDLTVVDEDLNQISESFKSDMNADYSKTGLNQQIIQNTLTGCTAMYNRALSELITSEPEYTVMHDWWLILIASAFGHVIPIKEQTIYYRQHKNNEIGAKNVNRFSYKIHRLLNADDIKKSIHSTYPQAKSFLDIYRDVLSNEQIHLLEEYCSIPTLTKIGKWKKIVQLHTYKNGFTRNLGYFLFI